MFADGKGIPVERTSFTLTKEMAAAPRRIQRITVAYRIATSCSDVDFRKIVAAGKTCPVRVTLGNVVEVVETFERA